MKRTSLDQRLAWLNNGYEDNTEYNYVRMQRLLDTTMTAYFANKGRFIANLAKYLGLSEDMVQGMTYANVIREISRRWNKNGFEKKRRLRRSGYWPLPLL